MRYHVVLMVLIGATTLSTSALYATRESRQHHHVAHTEGRKAGLTKMTPKDSADTDNPLFTRAGNTLSPFPGNFFKQGEKKRVEQEAQRFEEELVNAIDTFTTLAKTLPAQERKAQQKIEEANRTLQQAEADLAIKEEKVRQAKKNRAMHILNALSNQGQSLPLRALEELKEAFGASTTSDIVGKLGVQGLEAPETINTLNAFADKWGPVFMPEDAERNKTWVRVISAD